MHYKEVTFLPQPTHVDNSYEFVEETVIYYNPLGSWNIQSCPTVVVQKNTLLSYYLLNIEQFLYNDNFVFENLRDRIIWLFFICLISDRSFANPDHFLGSGSFCGIQFFNPDSDFVVGIKFFFKCKSATGIAWDIYQY